MEIPKIRDKIFNTELKNLIRDITKDNKKQNLFKVQEDFFYFLREDRNIKEKKEFLSILKRKLYAELEEGYKAPTFEIDKLIYPEKSIMKLIGKYIMGIYREFPFFAFLMFMYSDIETYYYPVIAKGLREEELANLLFSKAEKNITWIFQNNTIRFLFKELLIPESKDYILFKKKFPASVWKKASYFVFVPLKVYKHDFGFFLFIGNKLPEKSIDEIARAFQNYSELIPLLYKRWIYMQIEKRKRREPSFFEFLNIYDSLLIDAWSKREKLYLLKIIWKDKNEKLTSALYKEITEYIQKGIEENCFFIRYSYNNFLSIIVEDRAYQIAVNKIKHLQDNYNIHFFNTNILEML